MSTFFGSVWWLLVALGVLVTFHEFGHFWVARRCGVKVLRFSIGFGKPLWTHRGKDGTEYVLAAIPLGGYVRMLDEREDDVPAQQLHLAFNRKPVLQRIAIVAAGPLANLVLAFGLLWAMLVIGRPDYAPVVGQATAIAAQAGLQPGDHILAVGDRVTPTWSELVMALNVDALDRQPVTLSLRRANGRLVQRTLPLQNLPASVDELRALSGIGLIPRHLLLPALVGSVREGSPAWGVLAEGDRITAIDSHPVVSFEDIAPLVAKLGARGGPGMVEVERDGERLALELTPRRMQGNDGQPHWILGVTNAAPVEPPHDAVLKLGLLAAVPAAVQETGYQAKQIVDMVMRAVSGKVSVQNTVSGPITIARAANDFASRGPAWFLNFLALLSVSLALINLLPIPVLDGGHLLYYLIELTIRRPLGERAMAVGQYLGLAMIAGLMGLAFYNDILHLVS
ncbi:MULTISPECIES: RIP metalloprotease RseP [Thermomonas]|jgi:regulator of sigma E protease|uniref:Zinc metalloprotease n=1 Tax=Thermomonas beijingensis TaxID=2872701 RepID=A0ABS7TCA9_9GAMM|nr:MULTISPECIES: RIP metalloprotease RseP [Thermomonas]MBS0459432.1 RIP metalloprotease RseP [Pseudomonadota bacterium]MBZ4185401.1 RIP metalloprotease RseP [Thermomonas beijingensis]HOC10822.1 RIP metalloprotease RseP [Thermomonas sp.]HQA01581.1 RIP metalloprotease RseP [Thermomonas sp.]HQE06854.1 RIP metalloprotease RseP [Thermomonas sp.]